MKFKMHVDDFAALDMQEVRNAIQNSYKKPLAELKLFDLLINEERNTALRHGIYIFFDDQGKCMYIGMCSSSHFAHRLGGHFGMSPKYGMNTFLKRIVKSFKVNPKEPEDYSDYVDSLPLIANYGLVIIDANKKGVPFIKNLERLLHIVFRPDLNFPTRFPKTYRAIDLQTRFSDLMFECEAI